MPETFADKIIKFNQQLQYTGKLPEDFRVLNPYFDNPETLMVMKKFYLKFYNDHHKRKFIIGINPSRHGAGVTGVPFTDTKRLKTECGIEMKSAHTHEISSVFMYDMIAAFGGAQEFYNQFYINSPFPLAIIRQGKNGKWVNANYYDDTTLFNDLKPFMVEFLKSHIALGLDICDVFVLGKKNYRFLEIINSEEKLFKKMTAIEHPRYIQQYKSKEKDLFINKYILMLNSYKY